MSADCGGILWREPVLLRKLKWYVSSNIHFKLNLHNCLKKPTGVSFQNIAFYFYKKKVNPLPATLGMK